MKLLLKSAQVHEIARSIEWQGWEIWECTGMNEKVSPPSEVLLFDNVPNRVAHLTESNEQFTVGKDRKERNHIKSISTTLF